MRGAFMILQAMSGNGPMTGMTMIIMAKAQVSIRGDRPMATANPIVEAARMEALFPPAQATAGVKLRTPGIRIWASA